MDLEYNIPSPVSTGIVHECGKCDHFTIEQHGVVKHFYVTTDFYRCNPNFPIRSYLVVKNGTQGRSKVSKSGQDVKLVTILDIDVY